MPMVTVSISPLQAAGIRSVVDTGDYASSSEVVREALRLWDDARKRGELHHSSRTHCFVEDKTASDDRCVADMLADYQAERLHHA
jgi:antitoxin ParD1/3/4